LSLKLFSENISYYSPGTTCGNPVIGSRGNGEKKRNEESERERERGNGERMRECRALQRMRKW